MATLNPKLRTFWRKIARNRVLYGGRSSSKSWDAAGVAIGLSRLAKIRFLCTRQFQNKISESVYSLLKIQIERFGFKKEFTVTNNKIVNNDTGSEFIFYGLWRHIDEIKSLEGVDVCWIEEAHGLTENQWQILEPTIRKEGSQFWVIFNPRFATDFVYKRFVLNPPPDTIIRKINYDENKFLSSTMLKIIKAAKEKDYDDYLHVYEGVPNNNDECAIIKRKWVMAAIDAHKKIGIEWSGRSVVGYDVADSGDDKNAAIETIGSICVCMDEWSAGEDELVKSCSRVLAIAKKTEARIGYDCIGVGAGCGSNFNKAGYRKHFKFNAASKVAKPESNYDHKIKNKDFFANLKAQSWWLVAKRLKNTYAAIRDNVEFDASDMISISSDCDAKLLDRLIDELCTPKKDYDNTGKVKVESKKDLAKRDIKSPNLADAFIIAYSSTLTGQRDIEEWL